MRLTTASGLGILFALTATACGGGGGGTDASAPPDTSSTDDSGPTPSTLPPPTQDLGTTATDFACVGTATAPAGGSLIPVTMTLLSFGQDDRAAGPRVCFCPDNVLSPEAIAGTGCGACQDATSDASGQLSVMARAGGWYAYRVFRYGVPGGTSRTTFLDSAQVNETAPMTAGGSIDGNAVSALTANTIPAAQLIARTPGTTTIAGRVQDCDGPIRGAIVRAFHADGTEIPEGVNNGDPHYRFFNGTEMPDANATFTAGDGLYIVANITPASVGEVIRVETWANVDGFDAQIGCEAISIFPDGISIVNPGPSRSDYPAGHPCE